MKVVTNWTRIYPARSYSSGRGSGGFTFIELMVVMALLSLILLLAVPAFQGLMRGTKEKELGRLTGVMRSLRTEAILARKTFRLMFDIKQGLYSVEERDSFGEYRERNQPEILASHEFPPSMVMVELLIFGNRYDRLREDPIPIRIDSSGFVDPFVIHFNIDGKPWSLKSSGLSGKLALKEGYVEN